MITAWLKIRDRKDKVDVLKHLDFWLDTFSDTSKYNVVIYNEDYLLPEKYKALNVISRKDIETKCPELVEMIGNSKLDNFWKPAGFALAAPYWYLEEDQFIWNVDSDDQMLFGNVKDQLSKVENLMIEGKKDIYLSSSPNNYIATMSYDLNYSLHFMFGHMQKHHWSFGVNIADSNMMKSIITGALATNCVRPQWGINLDHLVHLQLERPMSSHSKYNSFITKEGIRHSGHITGAHYVKYNEKENRVEGRIGKLTKYSTVHPKAFIL